MKIAIPLWGDKISPVFDTAMKLLVVEFKNSREVSRLVYHIGEEDLSWRCHRIKDLNPDVVICGAISQLFLTMLNSTGIDVIQHIAGKIEDIIEAYLNDDISNTRFLMPGCKRRGLGCCRIKKIWQQNNQIIKEDI
jgi:predicted Fe-Mo cluster-binding NifX family protein